MFDLKRITYVKGINRLTDQRGLMVYVIDLNTYTLRHRDKQVIKSDV